MNILIILILICIICIGIVFIESYSEFKNFVITEYEIEGEVPESFDGFTICVLADLHNYQYDEGNQSVIDAVNDIKPDICVIPGDLITSRSREIDSNLKQNDFLRKLCENNDVYYSMGNHERGSKENTEIMGDFWERYRESMPKEVHFLDNKYEILTRESDHICIYGLDIERYFYKRLSNYKLDNEYIENIFGKKLDYYTIMLAHNPEYFETYEKWGADLTIAGHIHGGMVRLPYFGGVISPKLRLFPKYDYGKFEEDGRFMVISGGLGAHFPKIRFNNRPELLKITLKCKKSEPNEEKLKENAQENAQESAQ